MADLAIGIDLGTYNSAVAFAQALDLVDVLPATRGPTEQGDVIPSFVRFDLLGKQIACGEEARGHLVNAPRQVVWGVKRLIGRSWRESAADRRRFLYPLAQGPDGGILIPMGQQAYTPADVVRLFLSWLKRDIESGAHPQIRGPIERAVITHPAYFESEMIRQTREAALGAGFAQVDLIAEPVAAALAYGQHLDLAVPQLILAIDWGAGTLDLVITGQLDDHGVRRMDQARPACGHAQLGGLDMDDALVAAVIAAHHLEDLGGLAERLAQGLPIDAGESVKLTQVALLRQYVERAKIALSTAPTATEFLPYRPTNFTLQLARTRADTAGRAGPWVCLDEVLAPLLARFRSHIEWALHENGLPPEQVDRVLLIGGPMHMPCVRQVVAQVFASNEQVTRDLAEIEAHGFSVDPMTVVAQGAALYAQRLVAPPALQLTHHYGLGFRLSERTCCGELLLRRGQATPCESAPLVLVAKGEPGAAIPVSLLIEEEGPESGRKLVGDYRFYPAFDTEGQAHFGGWLTADADGVVSAAWSDARVSGAALRLVGIGQLSGEPMDTREEIPTRSEPDHDRDEALREMLLAAGLSPEEVDRQLAADPRDGRIADIPSARVAMVRGAAHSLLELVDGPLQSALRERDPFLGPSLALLRDFLAHLPPGTSPYLPFAQVANGIEEVLLHLEKADLLSADQIWLLRRRLAEAAEGDDEDVG